MIWSDALELLVARTGHVRYRDLCADIHPDHEAWRAKVVELAEERPSLAAQAAGVLGAAGRAVRAAATGAAVFASDETRAARKAVCDACPDLDAGRCRICTCNLAAKRSLANERCPINKW